MCLNVPSLHVKGPSSRWKILIALSTLAVAAGCWPNHADDRLARSFIAAMISGDSAGARLIEPESELEQAGRAALVELQRLLPKGAIDTVVMTEWERVYDHQGAARKLTYEVRSTTEASEIQIWLVRRNGTTFVNTVRTSGPIALPR